MAYGASWRRECRNENAFEVWAEEFCLTTCTSLHPWTPMLEEAYAFLDSVLQLSSCQEGLRLSKIAITLEPPWIQRE